MSKRKDTNKSNVICKRQKISYNLNDKLLNSNVLTNDIIDIINNMSSYELNKFIKEIYTNISDISIYQYIFDILRTCNNIKNNHKKIFINYPFLLFVPNIISIKDVKEIKNFMDFNENNTYKTIGDERKYHFSESYQVYFPNNKLKINEIHKKSIGSPSKKIMYIFFRRIKKMVLIMDIMKDN